jgi:methionyl-tRNA formyltransferase
LKIVNWPLFIVASYGKIIPNEIIEMPTHKTLNIHPSLLPQYRGASPLPTAILEDTKKTGITIMQLDKEMDHGPIVAQKEINLTDYFKEWPVYEDFEEFMAIEGAKLLAEILPDWVSGKISTQEQDHAKATYTKKITKEDGLINLSSEQLNDTRSIPQETAYAIFRKIQAFHEWPQAHFFIEREGKKIRVKITEASFENNTLNIKKVIPEGKKEMLYEDFMRSLK